MQQQKLYIGFDESNNNQIPEIIVLAHSTDKRYTTENGRLRKGKKRVETIEEILGEGDVDFHFMVLYDEFFEQLRAQYNGLSAAVKISSTLHCFLSHQREQGELPEQYYLFVDGLQGINPVKEFMRKQGLNIPIFKKKGDESLPIINVADRIAYRLFQDLVLNRNTDERTNLVGQNWQRRIYPSIPEEVKAYFGDQYSSI